MDHGSVIVKSEYNPTNFSHKIQTSWGPKKGICIPDTECDYDPSFEEHVTVSYLHNEY